MGNKSLMAVCAVVILALCAATYLWVDDREDDPRIGDYENTYRDVAYLLPDRPISFHTFVEPEDLDGTLSIRSIDGNTIEGVYFEYGFTGTLTGDSFHADISDEPLDGMNIHLNGLFMGDEVRVIKVYESEGDVLTVSSGRFIREGCTPAPIEDVTVDLDMGYDLHYGMTANAFSGEEELNYFIQFESQQGLLGLVSMGPYGDMSDQVIANAGVDADGRLHLVIVGSEYKVAQAVAADGVMVVTYAYVVYDGMLQCYIDILEYGVDYDEGLPIEPTTVDGTWHATLAGTDDDGEETTVECYRTFQVLGDYAFVCSERSGDVWTYWVGIDIGGDVRLLCDYDGTFVYARGHADDGNMTLEGFRNVATGTSPVTIEMTKVSDAFDDGMWYLVHQDVAFIGDDSIVSTDFDMDDAVAPIAFDRTGLNIISGTYCGGDFLGTIVDCDFSILLRGDESLVGHLGITADGEYYASIQGYIVGKDMHSHVVVTDTATADTVAVAYCHYVLEGYAPGKHAETLDMDMTYTPGPATKYLVGDGDTVTVSAVDAPLLEFVSQTGPMSIFSCEYDGVEYTMPVIMTVHPSGAITGNIFGNIPGSSFSGSLDIGEGTMLAEFAFSEAGLCRVLVEYDIPYEGGHIFEAEVSDARFVGLGQFFYNDGTLETEVVDKNMEVLDDTHMVVTEVVGDKEFTWFCSVNNGYIQALVFSDGYIGTLFGYAYLNQMLLCGVQFDSDGSFYIVSFPLAKF